MPSLSSFNRFPVHLAFSTSSNLDIKGRKSITDESAIREDAVAEKTSRSTRIFIPDVLVRWPWTRQINPNYTVVKEEADAWIMSFKAFSPKAQDAFNRCDFNLLACLAYPLASKEHVRAGCDFMHLLFLFDEHLDWSTPSETRERKEIIMDALKDPHTPRPEGEWIGGEATRQFWERTVHNATPSTRKRLIQEMDEYLEGVVQESTFREDHRILDIKSYIDFRRTISAVKPVFVILELGLDIPDEVMSHPAIQQMVVAAVDIIALMNDIFSYNLEQRRGDDLSNMITCVMHEYHTDVNGAMLWVEHFISGAEERFRTAFAALPQWDEPLNSQVKEYCEGVAHWVRANDDWSFEGERYFGNKGLEIKESRWMSLLPKKNAVEIGPMHLDSSLL